VPAKAIMTLLGLELDGWPRYAEVWHDLFAHPMDPRVYRELEKVRVGLRETFEEKQRCPAADIMSHLWASPLFDEVARARGSDCSPVEEGTLLSETLLGAGVDTTTNMFAGSAVWLAAHPDARRRLIEEPELMNTAVDEFLRYFATAPALARTVTREHDCFGHDFRVGDRVLVSFMAANRDPRAFDRPDEIVLDRWPNRHMAFGVGGHRCLGSNLARLIFPILVRQLLERIPDYQVVESGVEVYTDRANITGWSRVPCTFSPRPRSSEALPAGTR
jgi:cytochrome P450